jgi:formylglycine-generating enzyme required for sulfatase activity
MAIAWVAGCHGDAVGEAPADASADSATDASLDAPGDSSVDTTLVDSPIVDGGPCGVVHPGPALVAAGTFCIDATEVTQGEYAAWAHVPKTGLTGLRCPAGHDYTAKIFGLSTDPVVGVEWCEAYDYCQWAVLRLCGSMTGGPADPSLFADASNDRWVSACSKGGDGGHSWPYGNSYDPAACNGEGSTGTIVSGSKTTCEGGYPGLFDMSGNVGEWEDACDTATPRHCRVRGGSFGASTSTDLACNADRTELETSYFPNVGFRCCAN